MSCRLLLLLCYSRHLCKLAEVDVCLNKQFRPWTGTLMSHFLLKEQLLVGSPPVFGVIKLHAQKVPTAPVFGSEVTSGTLHGLQKTV